MQRNTGSLHLKDRLISIIMKHLSFVTVVCALLFTSLFVSCKKANPETNLDILLAGFPRSEGEVLYNQPMTQSQWTLLKPSEGYWKLIQCYEKRKGEWQQDKYIDIHYTFLDSEKVKEYTKVWSAQGDGSDWHSETVDWHFDAPSSTLTIGSESYSVLYSGEDSFALLLYDSDIAAPDSNTSCTYYKFCRTAD